VTGCSLPAGGKHRSLPSFAALLPLPGRAWEERRAARVCRWAALEQRRIAPWPTVGVFGWITQGGGSAVCIGSLPSLLARRNGGGAKNLWAPSGTGWRNSAILAASKIETNMKLSISCASLAFINGFSATLPAARQRACVAACGARVFTHWRCLHAPHAPHTPSAPPRLHPTRWRGERIRAYSSLVIAVRSRHHLRRRRLCVGRISCSAGDRQALNREAWKRMAGGIRDDGGENAYRRTGVIVRMTWRMLGAASASNAYFGEQTVTLRAARRGIAICVTPGACSWPRLPLFCLPTLQLHRRITAH
jgi:hypothetical protein